MLLNILTSSINDNEPKVISDFNYLHDLARCSKCNMFILLKSCNTLFGSAEYDCSCIHEISIPYQVNTDLTFRIDSETKAIVDQYSSYFIAEEFDWVILPVELWDDYKNGNLIPVFDYTHNQYIIMHKMTAQVVPQIQMYKHRACEDFERLNFFKQLEGYFRRMYTLLPPEVFTGVHTNEGIRSAFDSKSSMGRFLCRLKNDNVDVIFYIYKSLFAMAKADVLDVEVRFDSYERNHFMLTYIPKKKKNPLFHNEYGEPFKEKIHCMYINMA